jgi:hypothetical protein
MAGRRLEFGFEGGTAVRVTVPEDQVDGLAAAAEGEGWFRVESEEGEYRLNAGKLIYVRLSPGAAPSSVGFGGA